MNEKKSPFNITIDRQVIKLLGAHLYGDTPSVVNELIANSHDAGAHNVWITIKTTKPYQIYVQDDGIGMSIPEINDYYLNIGYNRRQEVTLRKELKTNNIDRYDMGQKGIGKLAVFALSKKVRLISAKNHKYVGCFMDFDIICQKDGQPVEFDPSKYLFDDKLSQNGSGTLVILENVVKDLAKSYKFISSSIARSFVLNNGVLSVHIRKNDEPFKEIKRADIDYTEYLDVLATIGSDYEDIVDKVNKNSIEEKYKRIIRYESLVKETAQLDKKKQLDSLPKKISVFDKLKNNQIDFDFSFKGWIGTVKDEESFKNVLKRDGYSDDDIADKDIIIVDDNRISIYSRGKVGEYNILPKLKTKAANDAYLIGEIYVDDFENDQLIDMATSNRRGYQEDDIRYETLCKNLKLLVSRVVTAKQIVNRLRKEDTDKEESEKIKRQFKAGHVKSKDIFENMTEEDRKAVEEDHTQFSRAVAYTYGKENPSKLLISHKQDELRPYGDFIINVLLRLNSNLRNRIVFTSNPDFRLKRGEDIFEELKECFRPEFYVIFLFSKSFYDSNPCLAEAGAAWATNRKYMNFVVDISFSDIDKPLNNAINGVRFALSTEDEIVDFAYALKSILENIDREYYVADIKKAILDELDAKEYKFELPIYYPKRKHLLYPVCSKCGRELTPQTNLSGSIEYICECGRMAAIKAKIK
ncbi:MAG: ATP-binding protein [Clostridia bacterium]|nr:ATP-binding protein [Clostridia bacterium]